VRGVTASQIVVGGEGTNTLAGGASPFGGSDIGAEARYARANRDGGINGRQIKFVGELDDGGSPTALLNNLRSLVLNRDVYAVSPLISIANLDSTFLSQNQVPFVGYAISPGWCFTNYGFGINGCLENPKRADTTTAGLVASFVSGKLPATDGSQKGGAGHSYALAFPDNQQAGMEIDAAAARAAGFNICYEKANLPLTPVTDFSPYAAPIMSACGKTGPAVVFGGFEIPSEQASFVQQLRAAGWKGIMGFLQYAPEELGSPQLASAFQGSLMSSDGIALPEAGGAWVTQIKTDLAAIGHATDTLSYGLLLGYASADLTVSMLKQAGPDLSPTKFNQMVNGNWTYPGITGFLGPAPWPLDHTQQTPCGMAEKVDNAKLVSGVAFSCYQVIDPQTGQVQGLTNP
jgi:hypothetical protein